MGRVRWPWWSGAAGSAALILVPTVLTFVFVAPFYTGPLGLVLAVQVVLLVFVLASMAAAVVTDPGCLPPAPPLPDPEMRDRLPLRTVVTVHGTQVEAKLCFRCNMYRRPRSGHCSECNVCIDRYDHHCPYLSNCIGRRNYRFFLAFVLSLVVYALLVTLMCMGVLIGVANGRGFVAALQTSPLSFAILLFCIVPLLLLAYLASFHCWLVAHSITTNEQLLDKYVRSGNPFEQPLRKELLWVCCGGRPPRFAGVHQRGRGSDPGDSSVIVV